MNAKEIYEKAALLKVELTLNEKQILSEDARYSRLYAQNVLNQRFFMGEPAILGDIDEREKYCKLFEGVEVNYSTNYFSKSVDRLLKEFAPPVHTAPQRVDGIKSARQSIKGILGELESKFGLNFDEGFSAGVAGANKNIEAIKKHCQLTLQRSSIARAIKEDLIEKISQAENIHTLYYSLVNVYRSLH